MSEAAIAEAPAAAPAATPAAAPPVGMLTGAPITPAPSTPATPAHFFGEHIAKDGVFQEGWSEQLRAAGFERLANKAQLAKDEATLFKTLDETIGFVGKKQVGPTWPTEASTPEEISQFRKVAGVPDDPSGYALKPEKLPEGIEWDEADAQAYAELFHKHHVPKGAAQDLVNRHLESIARMSDKGKEMITSRIGEFATKSQETFQKEWGDMYDSRLESNRAFVASRLAPEEMADPVLAAALSHPAIVRMVDEARRGLREAPLPGVGHDVGAGSMSPRQQAVAIMSANPNWQKNPDIAKRVNDLYALDAAQAKRGR